VSLPVAVEYAESLIAGGDAAFHDVRMPHQRSATSFEVFYSRYVVACRELRVVSLTSSELLALIDCLAERAAATMH
jgi:hypothetical protein